MISDSTAILTMINSDGNRFSPYMGVRVGEIQAASKVNEEGEYFEWGYVRSQLNVADMTTHGASPLELTDNSVWQAGPDFLKQPVADWPVVFKPRYDTELPELVKKANMNATTSFTPLIQPDRFFSFNKLKRITAIVIRATKKLSKVTQEAQVSRLDLMQAEYYWLKLAQSSEDYAGKQFNKLGPAKDDNGLWRVAGRVAGADKANLWEGSAYHPIILPRKAHITLMAMYDAHTTRHGGVKATVATFRKTFYTTGDRKLAKKVRAGCKLCRILDKLHVQQAMGLRPKFILQPNPPFTFTIVDLFGPVSIKGEVQQRVRGKAYGVLFVCLTTGATQMETSSAYDTDCFLMSLRRFSSHRGWPALFFSDNGTQLKGANNELKQMWKEHVIDGQPRIQALGREHNFEWHFSPAHAPWRQGKVEALVKTVKRSLMASIGHKVLSFSELDTVLKDRSQINARSLPSPWRAARSKF